MTTHTPGPWARNISPKYPVYAESDHRKVAVALSGNGVSDAQAMANLRLIAAAPDLLAALENLQAWAEMMGGWDAPCWDMASAAIAKAKRVVK